MNRSDEEFSDSLFAVSDFIPSDFVFSFFEFYCEILIRERFWIKIDSMDFINKNCYCLFKILVLVFFYQVPLLEKFYLFINEIFCGKTSGLLLGESYNKIFLLKILVIVKLKLWTKSAIRHLIFDSNFFGKSSEDACIYDERHF
ncbi:hypothetical protein BpHYR1_039653 [Brachionus plicatilis]|uniref:Uncharacterized protein n=1 Tax=Brachionus plicatilis TaxID=10195 RepID=A0A3M7S7U1_BRAPC|nr:hypothetical protein BpHYR1_039653 [Brachionus plicatilis]